MGVESQSEGLYQCKRSDLLIGEGKYEGAGEEGSSCLNKIIGKGGEISKGCTMVYNIYVHIYITQHLNHKLTPPFTII
jgi:hypothetical protein